MNTASTIFKRNLKLYQGKYPDKKIDITPDIKGIVYNSMVQYAREAREEKDLSELRQGLGLLPGLLRARLSKWVTKIVRNQYCKMAQLRADTENYKMYVVQGRGLTFKIISTREFKMNKRIRVFKKDLTAKEMEEVSCFTAWPKKR